MLFLCLCFGGKLFLREFSVIRERDFRVWSFLFAALLGHFARGNFVCCAAFPLVRAPAAIELALRHFGLRYFIDFKAKPLHFQLTLLTRNFHILRFLVASKTLQSYFDGNSHFSRGYSIISTFTFSNSLALTVVENKKSYLTLMLIATLFSFATVHVELQNQNKAFVVWRPQPNPDVSIFSPS